MVRRVSAGRLRLWEAALQEFVGMRRELLKLLPVAAIFLVLLNLRWWPEYERGFLTGAFVVALAWVVSWVVWVMSGLGYRLNGVMAEDATNEVCRKHPSALASLPSYKMPTYDVDTVLVTRAAVYVAETKWRSRPPSSAQLRREVDRVHRDTVAFRRELEGRGVPAPWIRGLLVLRGPGARDLETRLIDVGVGDRVRVVSGAGLPAWLDGQDSGRVGPDFARDLVRQLRDDNQGREEQLEAGPVLRWLARAR